MRNDSPYPKDMFATRIPDRVLANISFSLYIVLRVANLVNKTWLLRTKIHVTLNARVLMN